MTKPSNILIADDDKTTSAYLTHLLTGYGYGVRSVSNGREALARLNTGDPTDLLILDVLMPEMDGIEALAKAKKIRPSLPVIIVSAVGQTKTVVEALKIGAADYLTKPFEDEEIEFAIENVLEKQQLQAEVKTLRRQVLELSPPCDIITASPKMLKIREIARHVSDFDVPVLLLGESGVGKEVVAHYIHAFSSRAKKPFVKVNCAALPTDLLESELFGYERGAFTGATAEKPGKFEMADTGFILLDEIGDMSLQLQAKLLHVLQDGEFNRLGGKHPIRVDTRVLAATNKRLDESVRKGEFREDLYFRLNVITLDIPPLRERPEDIPLLSEHFVEKYREKFHSPITQLPRDVLETFCKYHWPGNVRQLENTIKRCFILPDADLGLTDFGIRPTASIPSTSTITAPSRNLKDVGSKAAEMAERETVLRILEETHWNRKRAAVQLGICYKALLNKLKKWNLNGGTSQPS